MSTFESCSTTEECNEGNNSTGRTYYCADIVEKCLPIGVCSEVFDCSHVDNRPYAVAMCSNSMEGTLACQQGRCVMQCDSSTMDVNDLHVDVFFSDGTMDFFYVEDDEAAASDADKPLVDVTATPTPTTPCATTEDCSPRSSSVVATATVLDTEYCSSAETCLGMGECAMVEDCTYERNVFAAAFCMGWYECQEGKCAKFCGIVEPSPSSQPLPTTVTEDNDSNSVSAVVPCVTIDACSTGNSAVFQNEYCASDDTCMRMGNCRVVEDCRNENNQFAVAYCLGTMECQQGKCGMNCGVIDEPPTPSEDDENDNSAVSACSATNESDCLEDGSEYCSQSSGSCLPMGGCTDTIDCTDENNRFAAAMCIGTLECQDGRCTKNCDTTAVVPVVVKDGCGAGQCWDNTMCEWISLCDVVGECGEYNEFCESKRNSDNSNSAVSATCGAANESSCLDGNEYCSRLNGVCVPMGGCTDNLDCSDGNNMFAVTMCIGTLECQEERCTKICDTTDASIFDGETTGSETNDSNSVLSDPLTLPLPGKWGCTADSDCLGTTEYCAQGTCLTDGMCLSSSDCLNPSNFRFTDKKCLGYQYCDFTYGLDLVTDIQSGDLQSGDLTETLVGECNRNCGVPCETEDPQQTPTKERVRCVVTGCTDTTMLRGGRCPGAISCVVDYCEENCPGIYFDAAGAVVTDCSPTTTTSTTSTTSTTTNNNDNNDNDNDNDSDEIITAVDYGDNGDSYGDAITDNITVTDTDTFTDTDIVMKTPPSPTITCTSDADCNMNASSEGNDTSAAPLDWEDGSSQYYCAQGICLEMGRCLSDSDCTNPMNQFDDIRCLGYLTCSGSHLHSQREGDSDVDKDVEGTAANDVIWCTRICGESCEDGSRPTTDCESVNPCGDDDTDTTTFCPGAVSCRLDRCGVETCTAVYYNAAGEVVTDCDEQSVIVVEDTDVDAAAVGDSSETNGTAAAVVDSTNETMIETSSEGSSSSSSSSMDAIAATVPENSGGATVVAVANMAVLSVVTTIILIAFSSSSLKY